MRWDCSELSGLWMQGKELPPTLTESEVRRPINLSNLLLKPLVGKCLCHNVSSRGMAALVGERHAPSIELGVDVVDVAEASSDWSRQHNLLFNAMR